MTFVMGTFFSMNAFELLLWPLMALVVLTLIQEDEPRLWLLFGGLLGLALLNKHTSVFFGAAIVAGVLFTPARTHLATAWPWLGAALAVAMVTPNVIWQWANGWPSLEFYRNAQIQKNIPTPFGRAVLNQVMFQGLAAAPLWGAGAAMLIRAREDRAHRALGVAFVLLFAIIVVSGSSRPDRIGGVYPMAIAAGAVALERTTQRRRVAWGVPAYAVLVLVCGIAVAPVTLPVFPPAAVARYARVLTVVPPIERGSVSAIPQWLADRTGWESFVDLVAAEYRALPPQEQRQAVIYAPDYGHAGALELLGPARGIISPRVISNHNTYWMWGRGLADPQVLIAVGSDRDDLVFLFRDVRALGRDTCDYCMSWRNAMPIYLAKGPKVPIAPFWERDHSFR
jgi:hypothetical protein